MKKLIPLGAVVFGSIVVALSVWALRDHSFAVLQSAGEVAAKQRALLVFTTLLSLVIIVPVFVLTAGIVWRYRERNTHAAYRPDWAGSKRLETIWWLIPLVIIAILSVVTWRSSHELDPFRPLTHPAKPLKIQVVALQWKWLFLYPEQGVASVNYLRIPTNTPIEFELTADAPMNSFWVPQLGGQVYTMAGMSTQLHLIADRAGTFRGSSANLSGEGFAAMQFTVEATDTQAYNDWLGATRSTTDTLDTTSYATLNKPGTVTSPVTYASYEPKLYDTIIAKYMGSGGTDEHQDAPSASNYNNNNGEH